jgi:hypothetical protein
MYEKVYQNVRRRLSSREIFIIPDIINIILSYITNFKNKWIIKYKKNILDDFKETCKILLSMEEWFHTLPSHTNSKFILEKLNLRKRYKFFYDNGTHRVPIHNYLKF